MMTQIVSRQPTGGLSMAARSVGLVLGGTTIAALLIGWVALLLWLAAEAVITVVHWL